jgi:hypothetical protein
VTSRFLSSSCSLAVVGALAGALAATLSACPPSSVPDDARVDASESDSPSLDAPADARHCGLACATTQERCCYTPDGSEQCIDVSADVTNCGICGLDCVATQRGDRCIAMQCSCGAFAIGCTGEAHSSCCPVAPDGRGPRCANLGRDFGDCGECGRTCDASQANRCEGGNCRCGLDGSLCAGTEADLCCVDLFDVASCVDTTRDDLNCGGCNRRCGAFEDCIDGACVDFTIPDAGPIDAGPRDAGIDAAEPTDAATIDAPGAG